MLSAVERALATVEETLSRITGIAVLAVMAVIVVDVVGRYGFGRPIAWIYDVVSIYFINATLYLVASDTLRRGGHIVLDLKVRLLPERLWALLQGLAWLAVEVTLLAAAWVVGLSALRSWEHGEVRPGLYEWPVWLETGIVAFGLGLLALRVAVRLARFVAGGLDAAVLQSVVEPDAPGRAVRR